MLDILACGHYYSAVAVDQPLPDLRAAVNDACRERPRRIDRYAQLALLGSARCMAGRQPSADTGLYVGSRFASLSNTIEMHRHMIGAGEIPKPAHFINSLSNSAGYYVARNLQLNDRNLFVSRTDASLIAALQLAQLDLRSAAITEALVGVVDETVLPSAEHCRRLGVAVDTPLGEGSHWLQLTLASAANAQYRLGQLDQIHTLADEQALQQWLQLMATEASAQICAELQLYATPLTRRQHGHCLQSYSLYDPGLNYYPAVAAGALLEFIRAVDTTTIKNTSPEKTLLCVIADSDSRFHVVRARR